METWGVVFLGVIALSSVVQAVFLIGLAREGRRLGRQVQELRERIDREIRPVLDNLSRVTRNLTEVSDLAVLQVRRFDGLLADTVEKIEETTSMMRKVILRPLGPLVDLAAFLKGIRRGIEVYYQLRGFDRRDSARGRRADEEADEHLFI